MRLQGKSAIVTGGASGIGRAVAMAFAREGARVLVADVDAERAEAAVAEITAAGGQASFRALDVSNRQEVGAYVRAAVEEFGRLDVMVNNAGVPARSWQQTLGVNLLGVAYGTQYAAKAMAAQGGGSIINTASVGGLVALGGGIDTATEVYVATKHGVVGLTRELAVEYGPYNVRVNCVCPGPTETDLIRGFLEDETLRSRIERSTALKRVAKPEEIAGAYVYLASDEASFVTGTALVVDGGQTAGVASGD